MFFDLNVPVVAHQGHGVALPSKKNKGKQPQAASAVVFTPAQVAAIEARIDLLVHLGYAVLALNQIIEKKIDPKTHVNVLSSLLPQLKHRTGVVFLKRLTIVLDQDGEKGFGLTNANASIVDTYDLIALSPTTAATFSAACLTHSQPSPLTAHVITLPLTQPRLPFHLKHTLVRTAVKNGAVFEINYAGALGDPGCPGANDAGPSAKRNWWAAAREVVRVTKGKGVLVSGGVLAEGDYRGPRDVRNLITLLGLGPNLAHDASTAAPRSLVLRAQTRKTYRAVLSEPKVVVPREQSPIPTTVPSATAACPVVPPLGGECTPVLVGTVTEHPQIEQPVGRKRRRECLDVDVVELGAEKSSLDPEACAGANRVSAGGALTAEEDSAPARKKKKEKKKKKRERGV